MPRGLLTKCAVLLILPAALGWADEWSKKFLLTGRPDLRASQAAMGSIEGSILPP